MSRCSLSATCFVIFVAGSYPARWKRLHVITRTGGSEQISVLRIERVLPHSHLHSTPSVP